MLTRSQSMRHWTLRISNRKATVLAVTGLIGGIAGYKIASDEGLRRAIKMQSVAIVPLVKYRYYDWRTKDWPQQERDAVFDELHEKYSKVAVELIRGLKGFYIKLGQVISGMDNSGSVPQIYVERMKDFQNNCPALPIKDCIKVIERELGKPFDQVFQSIDPTPLGSASIGQVHRARLLDGQEVAVKIQHDEAEKFFKADVAASKSFCAIAMPAQIPLFEEIEKQFVTEFDYTLEAKNLNDVNDVLNSAPKELRESIVVPKPIIATRKVLVMTFVQGKTLYAKQRQFIRTLAEQQQKPEEAIERDLIEKAKSGKMPKPPSATVLHLYKTGLRARDYIRNGFAFSYNSLFGRWVGAPIKYEWAELPMDAETALTKLYTFFGFSLFKRGIFSSDPHGGNIMHVTGEKLGLIDMGQVKRLGLDERIKFAKLIAAMAHDDDSQACTDQIANLWRECGYESVKSDNQVTADLARFFFDRMSDDLLDKYGGAAVCLENMDKKDPQKRLPDGFVMCMRASALLRMDAMGLGYAIGNAPFSRVSPYWAPYALELLAENNVQPPPRVDSKYFSQPKKDDSSKTKSKCEGCN